MKKKLYKKEYGQDITIKLEEGTDYDNFFDRFVEEAIEGNNLTCGGSGDKDELSFIVELGYHNVTDKMSKVLAWVKSQEGVKEVNLGKLADIAA